MSIIRKRDLNLPISKYKKDILEAVQKNPIIIICGETGSGKTTQLPQYLLQAGLNNDKIIGITQPRRIAAINMAKRVSEEMKCKLGKEVGYEIRFENHSNESTKIKFVTDGILLNHCVMDPTLNSYGIIIIDEAHERSVCTDVLLGVLKQLIESRNDLRVIITSATINCDSFSEYFGHIPVLWMEGKMFPVEDIYMPIDSIDSLVEEIKSIVIKIHNNHQEKGHILIFLTGEEDIENCCEALSNIRNLVVMPLYGSIDYESQSKVFEPVETTERKVIVATNIAETSITIDGIRFVIDSGFVKQCYFNYEENVGILQTVRISRSQANQRKGRAGRTNNGWCFRLYSEDDYKLFESEIEPEIFRRDLCQTFLKLCSMGFDPFKFQYMDPPHFNVLLKCAEELRDLGCLNKDNIITETGEIVNRFPVEPAIGKVFYTSSQYGCSVNIITMFAMVLERNVFMTAKKFRKRVYKFKSKFSDLYGDYYLYSNVFNDWINNGRSIEWCEDNCVNFEVIDEISKVRDQLIGIMRWLNLSVDEQLPESCRDSVQKSMLSGYYKNVCRYENSDKYFNVKREKIIHLHSSSCLIKSKPELIIYHSAFQIEKPFIHAAMTIKVNVLKEFMEEKTQYKSE